MIRKSSIWLALLLLHSTPAAAGQLAGVTLPDTADVAGHSLRLNGMGLRTKLVFKVYVGGLYLEQPTHDPAQVIAADQVRRIELRLLRDLDGAQISQGIVEGFDLNSHARMGQLQARLDRLKAMFPAVAKGEAVVLTYVPGQGTIVTIKGRQAGVIEGKDFADALFAVWFGAKPADASLKAGMLGQ